MLNFNLKNILRKPTNTRFHYTPRYYKSSDSENVYQIKSKYRKDEWTKNYNDYRAHWTEDRKLMRNKSNYEVNSRLLLIIAVLITIVLYIFDFDWELVKSLFKFKLPFA